MPFIKRVERTKYVAPCLHDYPEYKPWVDQDFTVGSVWQCGLCGKTFELVSDFDRTTANGFPFVRWEEKT